jgi:xanthine dehydrogenase YagR molybdenum-binding subunit
MTAVGTRERSTGAAIDRVEGLDKVTGAARYAYEYEDDQVAYAWGVQSTIAKGQLLSVDGRAALAVPGVLAVIWYQNAPRLSQIDDRDLLLFQSDRVAFRGQLVAAVVAETSETARRAAELVTVRYAPEPHDVVLRPDHPGLYKPPTVFPAFPTDTEQGDFDAAFAGAEVSVDRTYRTAPNHNNPMEPQATMAVWDGDSLTLYESTQAAVMVQGAVARLFGLGAGLVRVVSPHVGGGFGSKLRARPQAVLAAMAARMVGRPVKIAISRQQMFAVGGYRTPTIQRVRLGADREGRLSAIAHDVVEQTSTVHEFAEQTAVTTRMLYAAPNRRTSHRLARLDVPTPSWMRAPGTCPGMFALESAIDELAAACGVDPVELRIRNEPEVDPETGRRFSSRNLVACLREGASRFGWSDRDPNPGIRREGRWLVGTGMAVSTHSATRGGSSASARVSPDGDWTVRICAADIGTGARTALTQLAADALEAGLDRVRVEIGDTALPPGRPAGGSMGTASWGSAVVKACGELRRRLDDEHGGIVPEEGLEVTVDTAGDVRAEEPLARHAFGAQFAEVRVDADTAEVRLARLLGVFAAGRIVNPKTARSQLIGGMTMGVSMALHEESLLDAEAGDYLNHDLANYHIATCADIVGIEVIFLDEDDPDVNPIGAKGIGELGIVGTAAAVANAVHHATGVRVRDLPIRIDRLIGGLP